MGPNLAHRYKWRDMGPLYLAENEWGNWGEQKPYIYRGDNSTYNL